MPGEPTPPSEAPSSPSSTLTLSIDDAIKYAVELQRQGDVAQATAIYEQVLALCPDHVDALHFLAIVEHQQGRSQKALELMARAVELMPEHPDLRNNQGNILRLLGRLDEAEAAYGEALRLHPDDANALNNLGTILRERGQFSEAVAVFQRVIAMRPDHYEAYRNLGTALGGLYRFGEAVEAHRRALELRPHWGEGYRHLGATYYALGRIDEALAIYRQWLAIEPHHPVARHLFAACSGADVPARASDEFIRIAFDDYASSFDRSLARLEYRAPKLVAEAVENAVGEGSGLLDVLDAGCGTGLCALDLKPYARQLVGVDLSERMLDRARERSLYDELVAAELTGFLGQHPGAYDLMVSADTLVYFGALDKVVQAAAAALRIGGLLVFTTERSESAEAPEGYRIHPHGRYSHAEEYLRSVLTWAGLEVVAVREVELRKEAGRWVAGLLVTARKPAAPPPASACSPAAVVDSTS